MISAGPGAAEGELVDLATGEVAYRLQAMLADMPTSCHYCIEGMIQGSLDDGSGGDPEFAFTGAYRGTKYEGSGSFHLLVTKPGEESPIGFMDGTFEDAFDDEMAGTLSAEWRICVPPSMVESPRSKR